MLKKNGWLMVMVLVGLLAASCTTSTSVGGTILETGYEVNDQYEIISPQTNFQAGDIIHYTFFNGQPFGTSTVTVRLLDSNSKDVVVEHDYEVDPNWTLITDTVMLNQPGKYKFVILINGKTRATHEVIIN